MGSSEERTTTGSMAGKSAVRTPARCVCGPLRRSLLPLPLSRPRSSPPLLRRHLSHCSLPRRVAKRSASDPLHAVLSAELRAVVRTSAELQALARSCSLLPLAASESEQQRGAKQRPAALRGGVSRAVTVHRKRRAPEDEHHRQRQQTDSARRRQRRCAHGPDSANRVWLCVVSDLGLPFPSLAPWLKPLPLALAEPQ